MYVSGILTTYPSPKRTFCPKWEVRANVRLREGYVVSFPETYIEPKIAQLGWNFIGELFTLSCVGILIFKIYLYEFLLSLHQKGNIHLKCVYLGRLWCLFIHCVNIEMIKISRLSLCIQMRVMAVLVHFLLRTSSLLLLFFSFNCIFVGWTCKRL